MRVTGAINFSDGLSDVPRDLSGHRMRGMTPAKALPGPNPDR